MLASRSSSTIVQSTYQVQAERSLKKCASCTKTMFGRNKASEKQLRSERDYLEKLMKYVLNALPNTNGLVNKNDHPVSGENSTGEFVRRLIFESKLLSSENFELRRKFQKYEHFLARTSQALQSCSEDSERQSIPRAIHEASICTPWISHPRLDGSRRVFFPGEVPSFYFEPLTRDEVGAISMNWEAIVAFNSAYVNVGDTLFRWTVYQAPLGQSVLDNALIVHRKYTTRLRCYFAEASERASTSDIHVRPLLATPRGWANDQCHHVSTQVLQEFDTGVFVMVTNVPSSVHVRYLHLDQRQSYVDQERKHAVCFGAIATGLAANARCQSVEKSHSNVEWVREGGACITLTEAEKSTVDVAFSRWATCENELHAEQISIQWAQFACQWAQGKTSFKLLNL